MFSLLKLIFSLTFAFADSTEGPCSLEFGFGTQNIEVMNASFNRSVYDGYGGTLTARYNALATDRFHFALRATVSYSELDNKADTALLHESYQNTSWAPGVEFRLLSLIMGAEYQSNKATIEMSGSSSHSVHTSFYSPQFFIGFDVPMDWWGLRLYYTRSEGDIPHFDTGLTEDSPWTQEQFLIAFRINFRHNKVTADPYSRTHYENSTPSSREATQEPPLNYRPARYFPKPSRSLGN